MLSVQRSSMGSSQPPNQDGPFGYSFDNFPFSPPPAPAPGPSLLDDNESNLLNNFFDGVSSDHFNMDFFSAATDGMDSMSFGWNDIPPTFMGTSSSFGQQPMLHSETAPPMLFADVNRNLGQQQNGHLQTTEEDVLAAASLLQNGHTHSNMAHHFPGSGVSLFDRSRPARVSPQHTIQTREQALQFDQPRPRNSPSNSNGFIGDTFYAELVFGSAANGGRQMPRSPPKSGDIQWGSDNAFGSGQAFVAPAGQKEELGQAEQNMMSVLSTLEAHSSTAASTQPSSPIISRNVESLNGRGNMEVNERDYNDDEDLSRPSKRRKSSKMKEEDVSDDDLGSSLARRPSSKKRRPKSFAITTRPSSSSNGNATQSPPPSKRRKSLASSAVKPNRENLTEDQKRENHIKSEQKRRTLIKEGFDDLGELVPDLRGGGHSKSAVLVMAADWLEDLIKGNEELRARIRVMERDGISDSKRF